MNVDAAATLIDAGRTLNTAQLIELGSNPGAASAWVQRMRQARPEFRERAMGLTVDLGRVQIPRSSDSPARPGPIVDSPDVVDFLVESLTDNSAGVRRKAGVALAALVPADMLARHWGALQRAFDQFPLTDGALLILGKTGRPEARAYLDQHPEMARSSAQDLEMVRARLGDYAAEDAVLAAYVTAGTPQAKALQARRLGYVGSDRAVRLLARDVRTPVTYAWLDAAQRSLRIHIIEGLHLAFQREPIFWPPPTQPRNDSYYEAIERWLSDRLGVHWDHPRPPFLYQQSAPQALPAAPPIDVSQKVPIPPPAPPPK